MARNFNQDYCKDDKCGVFQRWPANPDIAGIGVVAAFAFTSFANLLAVTVGYFCQVVRDGGRDGLLNDLDYRVIWAVGRLFGRGGRTFRRSSSGNRYARDGLETFILTLSDQQILTGLAIFTIAYIQHCTISTYHFIIVVSLGWFSSTTHLSTLGVLKHYLNEHRWLKYIRLVLMAALYVMLLVGLLVLYTEEPFEVPFQCRISDIHIMGGKAIKTVCAALVFVYLTASYLYRFSDLIIEKGGLADLFISGRDKYSKVELSDKRHAVYAERMGRLTREGSFAGLGKGPLLFWFVLSEFLDSFLSEIVWLTFHFMYGLRQLFWARYYVASKVIIEPRGDERKLGFGQLLALFLLVQPILTGCEAYSVSKKSKSQGWTQVPENTEMEAQGPRHRPSVARQDSESIGLRRRRTESPQRAGRGSGYGQEHELPIASGGVQLWAKGGATIAIFLAILTYFVATLGLTAWYLAYSINDTTRDGVIASLAMLGVLFVVCMTSYIYEHWVVSTS